MSIRPITRYDPETRLRMRELDVGSHRVAVVFGRAAQKPFGTVSNRDKITIGTAIREVLM